MKKYICSYEWGYIESDTILSDCSYYAEIINIDNHELGRLKRCSVGSKTENNILLQHMTPGISRAAIPRPGKGCHPHRYHRQMD